VKHEVVKTDITVVGGGLAGVCAAVAAAREGQTVSLVQNRPVLGGNASSEVRVWVCGATGHGINRYARETGIMGELFVENQFRNPEGNPYYWDLVVLETVRAEPNISLYLNTDVHEVEAEGEEENRQITAVTGWMMGSERRIRFESTVYLDCTGDGLIGFLAGAHYRLGREAKSEYHEEWAPEVADDITLGSTMLFYTKDAGRPVKYIAPSFAVDIAKTTIPLKRVIRSGDNGCAYWWIEWGGEHDTVHDNERIRDELWGVIYGVWDYIKNSGQFDAENMTLEWVGSVPGKREYRRFIGDYVLNQNDILAQREFADRIAYGGWSIDLHPPQGVYSTENGSKHLHADGIYHIPFRSLYSANVSNMLMAGRNISASHVAFGTTRVMATCAVMGEAAGFGAALCVQKGISPRELHGSHLKELQQTMLRHDAAIIGLRNEDVNDLALRAQLNASSTLTKLVADEPKKKFLLERDIAMLLPVDPFIDGIELLLSGEKATILKVELWDTGRAENYVPHMLVAEAEVQVDDNGLQWANLPLYWQPEAPCNAVLIVRANEEAAVYLTDRQYGTLTFLKSEEPRVPSTMEEHQPDQPVVLWGPHAFGRQSLCFRLTAPTEAFMPNKVIDGYARPYAGPHSWSSTAMLAGQEEWLEFNWEQTISLSTVQLTFNDDVNEDLINLHHHRTSFEVIPELVRDYRIEAEVAGAWVTIVEQKDNHKRHRQHRLQSAVQTKRLRIVVEAVNGGRFAEIIEVRVYA